MKQRFGARGDRQRLGGGIALASLLMCGVAAVPAAAQETRFFLRNGAVVCGTVLGEQGSSMTVQAPNGLQVILRRDQIARRQAESCEAPAPAPQAAAAPAPVTAARTMPAPQPAAAAPERIAAAPARPAAPPAAQAETRAAAAAPQPAANQLRLAGADVLAERMAPDLVDAYLSGASYRSRGWSPGSVPEERVQDANTPDGQSVQVSVRLAGGSNTGMQSLNENRADIALLTRSTTADEQTAYRNSFGLEASAPVPEVVASLDGQVAIVHPDNPVTQLSLDQLRDIFAGTITNWSALGGPNLPIKLVAGSASSDNWNQFNTMVMRRRAPARNIERVDTNQAITTMVGDDPGMIGLLPFAFTGRNRALTLSATCGIEFEASEFNIRTEDYPLSRRLFLVPSPRAGEATQEFLRYVSSAAAFDVVQGAGYISLQPMLGTREYTTFRLLDATRAAPASPDSRYAEAMLDYNLATRGALRVSTTFRFQAGSSQLDTRGQDDLDRLAEFLRQPENARYKVKVLGFTDAAGAFGQNRVISERRANEVSSQLRQRGITVAQSKGYGSIAPVQCDDDADASIRNRRVEIWLGR